jgi:hypothetical protein
MKEIANAFLCAAARSFFAANTRIRFALVRSVTWAAASLLALSSTPVVCVMGTIETDDLASAASDAFGLDCVAQFRPLENERIPFATTVAASPQPERFANLSAVSSGVAIAAEFRRRLICGLLLSPRNGEPLHISHGDYFPALPRRSSNSRSAAANASNCWVRAQGDGSGNERGIIQRAQHDDRHVM